MRDILLVAFLFTLAVIWFQAQNHYEDYQEAKGWANARFLDENFSITVDPMDARFFNVVITTYDINIDDMDVFTTINN